MSADPSILVAIGANLPADGFADPGTTCEAAVRALDDAAGIRVIARSGWYESEPVPPSNQPWYVNGVLGLSSDLAPEELLGVLHGLERSFGRHRRVVNEARPLDLDIVDCRGVIRRGPTAPILPHPRTHLRAFVLLPLREIAPQWQHPVTCQSIDVLIANLSPASGMIRRIAS